VGSCITICRKIVGRKKSFSSMEVCMKNTMGAITMIAVLFFIATAICFAGGQQEAEQTKIKFLQMEYDNKVVPYMQEVARKFEEENPNIKVEIVSLGWDKGHETLLTWIKGKQVPDVGNTAQRWIAEWDSLGALEVLDPYISDETLEKIPEHYQKTGMYKEKRFGLPYFMDHRLVYYRSDLFSDAGLPKPTEDWGWEDFENAAIKTTDRDAGIYGYVMGAGDPYFFNIYTSFLWSAGGDYWDESGNVTIDSPPGLESLTFLDDLVNKYEVTQPGLTATAEFENDKIFIAGNASMIYTGPWVFGMVDEQNPDMPYGMINLPVKDEIASIAAPDLVVMFSDSKNKEAAGKFLDFQYRDDIRKGFVQGRGCIPDTFALIEDPDLATPKWEAFQKVAPYAVPQPVTLTTSRLMEEVMKMGQAAFLDKASPKSALEDLAEVMETLETP
jgi:multiple sugar transport system substrate-binding protein